MVEFTKLQKYSTKEFELIKITDDVREIVANSKIKNGLVFVILSHTTAGIMINESLPCLERDIEDTLEELIPLHKDYAHFLVDHSLGVRLIIIFKRQLDKFDHIGNQFPLYMGEADNLCRHDDLISALSRVAGADKIAAVM